MVSSGNPSEPSDQLTQEEEDSSSKFTTPINPNRRPNKKRKLNAKKQQTIQKKFETLTLNLHPIPFLPSKALDFDKHQDLLKRLGLWDFVHIEFDREIKTDLIVQLICNFDPKSRYIYVNDYKIGVNRADLARALKLPVKKEKGGEKSGFGDLEVKFLGDFLSSWVLLHEDTWIMPADVLNWTKAVKNGELEKVDWASLVWCMLEKELSKGEHLVDCYYASHLQCLIKSQRPEVFFGQQEEPVEEVNEEQQPDLASDEPQQEPLEMNEEEQTDLASDEPQKEPVEEVKEEEADLKEPVVSNDSDEPHPHIELTLGQDKDMMIDDQECKQGDEDNRQWILERGNSFGDHFMQPCKLEKGMVSDSQLELDQDMEDEEEEEQPVEEEPEDGLTGNLIQSMETMETTQVSFDFHGQTSQQTHNIFDIGGKRQMDHEIGMSHHKKMRPNDHDMWDDSPAELGFCIEQLQNWTRKASAAYQVKERSDHGSNMNHQLLLEEYQNQHAMMEHMLKTKCEEIQRKNVAIFRLERELSVVGSLIDGYRKALKETNKAFLEYREKSRLPEEPLYKDAGPGGLVLSTNEIEKRRLKQEEEDRLFRIVIERQIKDLERNYMGKLEECLHDVSMMDERLMDFENKVRVLKVKSSVSEEEEVQEEEAEVQEEEDPKEDPKEVPDVLEAKDELIENPPSDATDIQEEG